MLLQQLAQQGHAEDTLVVVTADHGEAFRERGFEGHAREVFRETTEVPFVLAFPFRLEPGIVVDARTQGVDLWPTVLDLLGLEPPSGIDGRSLVPLILASARGEDSGEELRAVAHLDSDWGKRDRGPTPTVAVTDGPFRYVRTERSGRKREQLFDARRDPDELDDRAAEDPEELERLRTFADSYLETAPPWGQPPIREVGELELNQLRALGYALP
jgi:arylsulfatase A-like enzyme